MSAAFTPGPWDSGWDTTTGLTGPRCAPTVYLSSADLALDIPIHCGGRPIAWVLSSLPDDAANADARLIAAAPTMLDALIKVSEAIYIDENTGALCLRSGFDAAALYAAINNAIGSQA